jgi:hypothetical protein
MLFLEHLMRSSLFLASQGRYELVPGGIAALMHWYRLWPLGTQQGPFAKHTHLCITGPVGGISDHCPGRWPTSSHGLVYG